MSHCLQLLWPRLLIYVMPAKYTGMLIPLSRCLRALAESNELTAGHEHHELDPDVLNALLQGRSSNSPKELC